MGPASAALPVQYGEGGGAPVGSAPHDGTHGGSGACSTARLGRSSPLASGGGPSAQFVAHTSEPAHNVVRLVSMKLVGPSAARRLEMCWRSSHRSLSDASERVRSKAAIMLLND